jgi:heptosyltransferase I
VSRASRPSLLGPDARRVGIVMLSAVGDAVHVLPVVNALKRHRPDVELTWVIQRGPLALVRGHPAVDEFVEVAPTAGGLRDLRRRLAGRTFDLVLDLQVALKGGLATALVPARARLGFDRARARDLNWLFTTHRIPPHPRQHVLDQYFEFLQFLDVPVQPVTWRLGPWEQERAWQREFFAPFDRPVAAVVCGTSDPDRDWLPERWAAVCDALDADHGLQPVLVGGPTARERATAAEVVRLARRSRPVDALGSGLRPLVSILDGSALVLSLDTAPLHMSVALDRPVVSLMSQADPRRTGPYGRFQDLVVDAFTEPGDGPEVIWERRRGRMGRIGVADVLAKVERWRTHYAPADRATRPTGGAARDA